MVEKILKTFEQKRAEALKQPGFQEKETIFEKQKEILKQAVSEEIAKTKISDDNNQQATDSDVQKMQKETKERQIQLLTGLAFEKGLSRAIEVAKRLDSPYLLDEFHDSLVDELYNKLVQEGKLKQL